MKKNTVISIIVKILLCIITIFLLFWFKLPAINLRSPDFWSFLGESIVFCVVINAFSQIAATLRKISAQARGEVSISGSENKKFSLKNFSKPIVGAVGAVIIIALFSGAASLFGAEIFNAKSYNQLIKFEDSSFQKDVSEISQSQIPVVDYDSAERLGKRKLGEMSDLVSQFEIADDYTQINYKKVPTRVTPLEYGDIIKWFNNQSEGLPAYITVDMTTQETSLIRLKEGMKYSESEILLRNIHRYLRFKYPFTIFDSVTFEIDDNGTPFWVASTVDYKIGLWSGRDVGGAVLVNAVTGESEFYSLDKVPTWVDQVFDSDIVLEQLAYNGKYRSGFWNSVLGQKGVLKTTDGYNYLAIGDDVWLYTGMTSVASDESNVGFVLVNLRTKETKYYAVPGAEENSAMGSAEGQVQNLGYNSTFPLLLNISNRPTYFMSLKDDAGLVKMYAFVDVEQYQIVGTGITVDTARENYISKLTNEDIKVEDKTETTVDKSGKIAAITSAVVGGNTKYYIMLEKDTEVYTVDIKMSDKLPFAKVGDDITFTFTVKDKESTLSGVSLK